MLCSFIEVKHMINLAILMQCIKSNIKCFIVFTFILCTFMFVICGVFTPRMISELSHLSQDSAFTHILGNNGTLISFLSNSFYAYIAIIVPMLYSIIVGHRLICDKVDGGSMACYLSTPVSRITVTMTSALYFIMSLMVMWIITTCVGYLAVEYYQKGTLDMNAFILLNLGCFLYHFVISSICFCSSCIFNSTKRLLIIGAGLPLAIFVLSLLVNVREDLAFLKYITLNTLYDTQKIVEGGGYINDFYLMIVIGCVLYGIGIIVFQRKDLPL